MPIQKIDLKGVMIKSNLPLADFSVNPYVGCTHGCKYCYASFMKRFTNHTEPCWSSYRAAGSALASPQSQTLFCVIST